MITVQATGVLTIVFQLEEMKIRKDSMESIKFLGTKQCRANGAMFDGPICYVVMTSGRDLYINATSEELEARSA